MASGSATAPIVQMTGISVIFPGVRALEGVDFRLFPGEVHSLMGENGAGKSTLIKALTGINQLAAGSITVGGVPYHSAGPEDAQAAGISTVYQEVNLCGNITVAENIMLGHEIRKGPFIDWRATRKVATELLTRMHLDIDPRSQLSSHTIAVQQLCAIARALVTDARVLILDEPTSSLDRDEVAELFTIIRELRDEGVAILFVSHFLDQIYEISDRMTVLRNGRFVGEELTANLPRRDLISMMVGRTISELADIEQEADDAATDL
ncbi:MAG: ATP-binding cassette domain-containing protein, partial [Ruaniaceae bacterium]|nr:ATP-binding cassette domain-containing protein [Ruaniaceae bacterium]